MKDKINSKFFKICDEVQIKMNELQILYFKLFCPINVDDFNINVKVIIKKEKETEKSITKLKDFCVINQIPFDCDKYYGIKNNFRSDDILEDDREAVE